MVRYIGRLIKNMIWEFLTQVLDVRRIYPYVNSDGVVSVLILMSRNGILLPINDPKPHSSLATISVYFPLQ